MIMLNRRSHANQESVGTDAPKAKEPPKWYVLHYYDVLNVEGPLVSESIRISTVNYSPALLYLIFDIR